MNAVIYARYNSNGEGSLDAETRAIKEYADKNNLNILKTYIDKNKSGSTDDRPQFLKMIKDSSMKHFSTIIVYKIERFSRNRFDTAYYKNILKSNNVKLLSVSENLDVSQESIILESVIKGMYEYYSANLARQIKKGKRESALQCKHNGGKAPLGYDVSQDKTYIINEDEAKVVKLIFNFYDYSGNYKNIIKELNLQGYKTKLDNAFDKNSIYRILRNEKYSGVYIFNKTSTKVNREGPQDKSKEDVELIKIEGGMPNIIDKDLFERVQIKMNSEIKVHSTNKDIC